MPVTARLSRKFYETFGDDLANEIVEWFNQVDFTYRTELRELNEVNFARFEAKLDAKLNAAKAKIGKAVGLVGQGKTKPAGKAVQRALGAVRGFRRRVRSKGAGKVIVPDAVPTLVGAADRLLGDLATLRREIGSS